MSDMQPPLALENLPATRAVWKALVILQNPMRTVSRISRVKKITSRLETTMRPDTPTYGRSTIDYALKQLSAHERIYYHANIKAFEAGWQALCTALSIHPCDGKKHFLVLRAHAKAEALGGEHSADAGRIKWSSGNVAVLFPFLDRLAQYERLSAITPDGPRHRYVFVHRHRDGPATHYSHNYTHNFGVDAADAALRIMIGTERPMFEGVDFHGGQNAANTPRYGAAPEWEANWKDVVEERASLAGLTLDGLKTKAPR